MHHCSHCGCTGSYLPWSTSASAADKTASSTGISRHGADQTMQKGNTRLFPAYNWAAFVGTIKDAVDDQASCNLKA